MRRITWILSLFLVEIIHNAHQAAAFIHQSASPRRHATHVSSAVNDNVMSKNQLLHCMLRVSDVNATVDFWKEQGAHVHSYRLTAKAETAFVGFGKQQEDSFSLEITKQSPENFQLGNAIQYFGVSMLRNINLIMAAAGETSGGSVAVEKDPNGIEVRPVASAPGDLFARICLKVDPSQKDVFAKTTDFYETLGMKLVAADEQDICLRYDNAETGVATTLVFSKSSASLEMGNCLDHFAISTKNVDAAFSTLRESLPDNVVFMDPTRMFGTKIMGLHDPNGYKVYLVEQQQ